MFALRFYSAIALSALLLIAAPKSAFAQPTADAAGETTVVVPEVPKTKTRKPRVRKPKDPNAKPKVPQVRGTAYVRVLHAIEGGASVDVFVDGGKKAEAVSYKTLSDYLALPSGSRVFSIKRAGTDETLASLKKSVKADTYYVIAATTVEGKPGFVWQNEMTGKPREDRASVRIYHLAAGAPSVQITTPSTRGKNKMRSLVKELIFGKPRTVGLAAGTASLQVRAGEKMLKESPATVEVGKRYAVFAVGDKDAIDLIVSPVGK